MTRTQKHVALAIAERAYAKALIKRAISDEALTGRIEAKAQPGMSSGASLGAGSGVSGLKPAPAKPLAPVAGPSAWDDGKANASRISLGILGTAAGGLSNVGTGAAAGATNAWNAVTPRSMNTPDGWTQGVNDVFNKSLDFFNSSAADVYGGLGGTVSDDSYLHPAFKGNINTDYHTSRMNNQLEKGWNDPNVDPRTRAIAQFSADVGKGAWEGAQTVAGGNLAARALKAVPGYNAAAQAYSRVVPDAAKRTATYATGLPFSGQANPWLLQGSMLGQSVVDGFASGRDANNARNGTPTNWSSLVPINWPRQALAGVAGQDAADKAQNVYMSRALGPGKGAVGWLLGPQTVQSAVDRFGPQETPSTPYADAASYAEPDARADLYERAGTPTFPAQYASLSPADRAYVSAGTTTPMTGAQRGQGALAPQGTQQPEPPQVDPTAEPTQTAETTQPAQSAQPAQPELPQKEYGVQGGQIGPPEFKLPENAPPEVRAQVDAGTKYVQGLPDADKATATVALQKPDSPEAKQLTERGLQNAVTEAANDPNNPPPKDPQGYGQFVTGVVENFQKMDTPSQIAMGLGLGLGLLGLINSFSGEGGMGSFLMSALGLGAAGVGAAGAGMFGDQAQQMVGQGIRSLAGGMISEGKQDLSLLTAQDPVAAAMSNTGVGDISGQLAKVEQLKQLTQLPSFLAVPLLRSLDPENIKTPEDAQRAYANAQRLQAEVNNPESALAQRIQMGRGAVNAYNNASNTLSGAGNYVKNLIGSWAG